MTRRGAAEVMGISERRVGQLAEAERIPYAVHHTGARLYRRAQIEVVGNARRARFTSPTPDALAIVGEPQS